MLDIIATHEHYLDHVLPIRDELVARGVPVRVLESAEEIKPRRGIALVASYGDLKLARAAGRSCIYMEHGAGQSYSNTHGSYAGSGARNGVVAFLNPGHHVAKANMARHPRIPSYAVGVPKLDKWHRQTGRESARTVCISFHWDCRICPESRSAFTHYEAILQELAESEHFTLIGHCHPRARAKVLPVYERLGIEFVERFDDVLERADLYVCDNSSTIYEFASVDRPVVLLNAPWYRKQVNHGLRFWRESRVGIVCDDPHDLHGKILEALEDTRERKVARRASVSRVYYYTDGLASHRAADAIQEVLMSESKQTEGAIRLKCLRTLSGPYGVLCPGWTLEILPNREMVIYNKRGVPSRNSIPKLCPGDPAKYAATLTQDRGRLTQFEYLDAPEAKPAPAPQEDKLAPPVQEDKQVQVVDEPQEVIEPTEDPATEEDLSVEPETEEVDSEPAELSPIEQALVDAVKGGANKGAALKAVGSTEEFTYRAAAAAFDALVKAGKIVGSKGEWSVA